MAVGVLLLLLLAPPPFAPPALLERTRGRLFLRKSRDGLVAVAAAGADLGDVAAAVGEEEAAAAEAFFLRVRTWIGLFGGWVDERSEWVVDLHRIEPNRTLAFEARQARTMMSWCLAGLARLLPVAS